MAFAYSPKIVTDGLVFAVDAANKKSYPGSGTSFNNLADFWRCTFKKPVVFYKTDFNSTTVFSASTFEKNVSSLSTFCTT